MEVDLYERVFGKSEGFGDNTYVFIPVDEAIRELMRVYEIGFEELKRISITLDLFKNLVADKGKYKDGVLTLWSGAKFSFDLGTMELDNIETLDSYDEGDATYITINGFPLNDRQDEAIMEEVRKINENTEALNKMNRDALGRLLATSSPKDILRLCQTNEKFRETCKDQRMFKRFLDQYYPNAVYTDDPKRQFIALTSGVKTFYRMDIIGEMEKVVMSPGGGDGVYRYTFRKPVQLNEPAKIEDIPGWSIDNMPPSYEMEQGTIGNKDQYTIIQGLPEEYKGGLPHEDYLIFHLDGLPPSPGEKLFLLMDTGSELVYEVTTFKTREALAEFYASKYDSYLDDLLDMFTDLPEEENGLTDDETNELPSKTQAKMNAIIGRGLLLRWENFLKERGVRLPFTPEHLKEQAMNDENLYLSPDTYHYQFQIIELTF